MGYSVDVVCAAMKTIPTYPGNSPRQPKTFVSEKRQRYMWLFLPGY